MIFSRPNNLNNKKRRSLLCTLFLFVFIGSSFSQVLLQEDFMKNTSNVSGARQITLTSGVWDFYYVNSNYGGITQCAVLNYSSQNMGYIVSPVVNQPGTLTFDARMQNTSIVSNSIEVQISVNGGVSYTSVGPVPVSGTTYKSYSININSTSDNVRIKLLRGKLAPESTNYNIIIDNIRINTANIDIPVPCSDLVSFNITPPPCGNKGTISLLPKNVSNVCSVIWKTISGDPIGTTNTLTGVSAGKYKAEINCNGALCDTIIDMIEAAPKAVYFKSLAAISTTKTDCGKSNGSISLTPIDASKTCPVIWRNSAGIEIAKNKNILTGIPAGQYKVEMDCGCYISDTTVTVLEAAPKAVYFKSLAAISTAKTDCGKSNGSISLTPIDASKTCPVIWRNSAGVEIAKDKNILTGIPAGQYKVEMDCGCYISDTTVTVLEAAPKAVYFKSLAAISTAKTDCGKSNGSISLTPIDASKTCPVIWRNSAGAEIAKDKNILTGIPAGQYKVEMDCGCYISDTTVTVADVGLQQIILEENFDFFIPSSQINEEDDFKNSGWRFYYVDSKYSSAGLKQCVVLRHSSGKRGYLITPAIATPKTLTFDARLQNWSESDNLPKPDNLVEVLISEGAPWTTWTSVGTIVIKPSKDGHRQDEPYTKYAININSTSNNVKVKILRMPHPDDQKADLNIIIDNIKISEGCANSPSVSCNDLVSVNITPPSCGNKGTITLLPKNASTVCSAVWKTVSGDPLGTTNILTGVSAGQYKVEINCNNHQCDTTINIVEATTQVAPLLEDFEEFAFSEQKNDNEIMLHGKKWYFNTCDDQYSSGSANGNALNKCVVLRHSGGGSTLKLGYLITPAINAPKTLSFMARVQNWALYSNSVEVQISENGGTWRSVGTIPIKASESSRQDEPYSKYSININSTSNNVKIKILRMPHPSRESSDINILIDNIGIDAVKNCDDNNGENNGENDGEGTCKGIPQIRIEEPTCDKLGILTLIPNTLYGQKQYKIAWKDANNNEIGKGNSINNITPGTYYAEISWDDKCSENITIEVAQAATEGHGLSGTYKYTSGTTKQQIDPVINFEWDAASRPKSVVWEGCLEIPCNEKSGEYIFYIPKGGKLYIDGKLVIGEN